MCCAIQTVLVLPEERQYAGKPEGFVKSERSWIVGLSQKFIEALDLKLSV